MFFRGGVLNNKESYSDIDVSAEETVPTGYTAITTVQELNAVRNDTSGKYMLMNDIDLTEATAVNGAFDVNGTGWRPINDFTGIFDGNGHAIKGLNMHGDADYEYAGLFGSINYNAKIKNLRLIDCDINVTASEIRIGGICGYIDANTSNDVDDIISNCFVSGTITGTRAEAVGGIAGYVYDNYGKVKYIISNCYSLANITNSHYAGGIVGFANCYGSYVKNCYNTGNIKGEYKGPIIGGGSTTNVTNCYYLNGTGSGTETGELYDDQMQAATSFKDWDFEKTWIIDTTTESYKYPQLRSSMQVPVTGVEIISEPDKTTYFSGEAIDLLGGKVRVNHEDFSYGTLDISEDMLGTYNLVEIGKHTIAVNYLNKSDSYEVEVYPAKIENVKYIFLENGTSFSWDKVTDAEGYIIYKYNDESSEWVELERVTAAKYTPNDDGDYAVAAYANIDKKEYIGEKTKIEKLLNFSLASVTVNNLVYNGSAQNVELAVIYNDKVLTEGTDYDIASGSLIVNSPGKYKLVLRGKGNYAGIKEVSFNVTCEHNWNDFNKCSICGESRYVTGDVNYDGVVNVRDSSHIANSIAQGNLKGLTDLADCNGDGVVDIRDAVIIARACLEDKTIEDILSIEKVNESLGNETLSLSSAEGQPGDIVTLYVKVECNNKFESGYFSLSWEDTALTAIDAALVEGTEVYSKISNGSCALVAYGSKSIADGNIAAIQFTVPKNAEPGTVYDINFSEINTFAVWDGPNIADSISSTAGTITVLEGDPDVKTGLLGDANGDGTVNVRDCAFIASKIAKGKTSELPVNADYNSDGNVNVRDAAALARDIAQGKITN